MAFPKSLMTCLLILALTRPSLAEQNPATQEFDALRSVEQARAWVEEKIARPMAAGAAPAAAVSVVIDGEIAILEGYGANGGPNGADIDPKTDLFLIASITKTFTALTIAQLIDQGLIQSIDDPVNKYLKRVQLESYHGAEITIRNVVTHAAGFEERGFGFSKHGATTIPAASDFIDAAIPAIVREPGSIAVYANIGPPILGALVEDITGITLQGYMATNIFAPLGMNNAILNYAANGDDRLVRPWRKLDNGETEVIELNANAPFFAPTGSIEASAYDMALYAIAMMSDGPIPAAIRENLMTQKHTNHPALPSIGMAWQLPDWRGHRIVEHAGAKGAFLSWLVLVPEKKAAMFIGWTSPAIAEDAPALDFSDLRDSFLYALLGPQTEPQWSEQQPDLKALEGTYWTERRPHRFPTTLLSMFRTYPVTANQDGLFIAGQGPYRAYQEDAFAFRDHEKADFQLVAFNDKGIVGDLNAAPRLEGLSNPKLIQRIAFGALAIAFSGLLAFRWREGADKYVAIGLAFAAGALIWALALPGLKGSTYMSDLFNGHTFRLDLMFAAAIAFAATTVTLAGRILFDVWRQGPGALVATLGGIHRLLILTAAAFLTWFASYGSLFNIWRLP